MALSPTNSMRPLQFTDARISEPISQKDAFARLPDELVAKVVEQLPDRATRSKFARTSQRHLELVADHVARPFQSTTGTGRCTTSTIPKFKLGEESKLLAEACSYARLRNLPEAKIGYVQNAFNKFLIGNDQSPCSKFMLPLYMTTQRTNFIADYFHVIPGDFKQDVKRYLNTHATYIVVHLTRLGRELEKSQNNDVQRCDNILQMSFLIDEDKLVVQSLHLGLSGAGVAKYIPKLNEKTVNCMVERILFYKKWYEPSSDRYHIFPRMLSLLIENISAFNPETRGKICESFRVVFADLVKSSPGLELKSTENGKPIDFLPMLKAINQLQMPERQSWNFVLQYENEYIKNRIMSISSHEASQAMKRN